MKAHWRNRATSLATRRIVFAITASICLLCALRGEILAEAEPKVCATLIAEGKLHLSRFEAGAAKLVLAVSTSACRQRLAETMQTIDAIDRVYSDLESKQCQVDPWPEREARQIIRRWEAHCALLDQQPSAATGLRSEAP